VAVVLADSPVVATQVVATQVVATQAVDIPVADVEALEAADSLRDAET
jgi:hypothetical protein